MQGNYEKVLEKISRISGLQGEEIERRVEAKRAKLSSLITHEGAAQIVAAELGINFDNEKLKIEELLPGMRKVNVIGKVINLYPIRTFTTKSGVDSKVTNIVIADETSNVKTVLWDTHHIGLIEKGEISEGKVVEIKNASMRDNELHLGSFSELKLSEEEIENIITEKVLKEKNISQLVVGDSVKLRAFVVQSFEPKFFHVCSQCAKKASLDGESWVCAEHGKCIPEKRAVMNIVLDDGSETIRAVLFSEQINNIGIKELEDIEKLISQREDLLGKEMTFIGNVRMNRFFNNPEFIIDEVSEMDLDELIGKLEKNI